VRRGTLALASIIGFAGCVTVTATPVKAPDGQPAILIECHQKDSQCVTEAQRVCPGGYWVLDAEARARGEFAGTGTSAATGMMLAPQTFQGRMMIRCQ
jgi:hypothetical protein